MTFEPSTSKGGELNTSSINAVNRVVVMEDMEGNEDSKIVWCIDDDTLFYAQSLKHHSTGKGKSVYITWNENYLLNFVFKTSIKTGSTTLTKVRISIPMYEQDAEEISNMLILEMNTLLYMKSGRVYYFTSVKSMHKVDWLTGIRCLASCPLTQFSVIRVSRSSEHFEQDCKKIVSLEVYKDVSHLGKWSRNDVLRHMYDISFDLENIFNCEWTDETYTLTSLITDEKNIPFLKQLISVGNVFCAQEEVTHLNINQEIHIFTISGNVFVLVGGKLILYFQFHLRMDVHLLMTSINEILYNVTFLKILLAIISEGDLNSNSQVENFTIRLLNTYACPIECIRIDCENNLLIVLLQSGHIDIWYRSKQMFGALFHCQHEITDFLDYDFCPTKNTFYFTTPEEVIQLRIITNQSTDIGKECVVKESRKIVGGMIACTFVEGLQQLICLSINNIFCRINFATPLDTMRTRIENESKYENLNNVYALNDKRVKDLATKAQTLDELMQQPKLLHNAIEKEFRKQQILALESKSEIFQKLFQCHLEYHVHLPGIEYFDNDYVHIRATSHSSQQVKTQSVFCLIFMSLKNNENNIISPVFTATIWYLHISNLEQSLQLHLPYEVLNQKICFIMEFPLEEHAEQLLPTFSVNLLSFCNHQCNFICLKYNLDLDTNEKTFLNLFSSNVHRLKIFRNSFEEVTNLLTKQRNVSHKYDENMYKLKQHYQIPKNVMEKLMAKMSWSLSLDFKIYFLHQYLIEFIYDESTEILLICSNYPMAIFYIKLLLLYATQSYNDVHIVDTSVHNMSQMIMNYQNEIEHLYGSIISSDSSDINSNSTSMHLENLLKIYLKIRTEFCNMFK